ncbi:MAG TPA: RDD family protein, partial [Candidatus Cybelea sp.]|nr:RDD family protein [Candidatus Cybelea sp.]
VGFNVTSSSNSAADEDATPAPVSTPAQPRTSHSSRPSPAGSVDVEQIGPLTVRDSRQGTSIKAGSTTVNIPENDSSPPTVTTGKSRVHWTWTNPLVDVLNPESNAGKTFWLAIYMTLLVAVSGQTFGMLITGLRVVTIDFRRPGLFRTIARYAIGMALLPLIAMASIFWRRVMLHDRWTKTRLVKVERVVARATGVG